MVIDQFFRHQKPEAHSVVGLECRHCLRGQFMKIRSFRRADLVVFPRTRLFSTAFQNAKEL